MRVSQKSMSPIDIVVLLKICSQKDDSWQQMSMAAALHISQSEISKSLARSKYAGLIDDRGKNIMRLALMDFLQYGVRYVFPQRPGPIVRGIPTAHSMEPLVREIDSQDTYVWPSAHGELRGQGIAPLYPSVVHAVKYDKELHELLALVDSIRVGKTREQNMAIEILRSRIC